MKRLILVLTSFVLLALPLAAQVNDTYIVPAAINSAGAFGTRWLTQFSVFNPQGYALTISVVYLPSGGGQGREALFTVPANAIAYSDNILDDLFGLSGKTGALLVATFPEDNPGVPDDFISRSFLVTTNTYNNSRTGTFGQTIPGTWTGLQDYDTDNISAVAHGIRHISSQGWRTNVGGVNLGRCNVQMLVRMFDVDGRLVREVPFNLPPLGHFQDSLPQEIANGSLEFFIDDPCASDRDLAAVVFPYASTIDNLSGDPRYQSPTLLASASLLFGKAAMAQSALFRKIGTLEARQVRATAQSMGTVQLRRDERGWRITR